MALESCRKWDTNRLEGRWKYVGGDIFAGQDVIFDFEKDGDFTREVNSPYFNYAGLVSTMEGEWKWAFENKLRIGLDDNTALLYDVILIKGNNMELADDFDRDWCFKKE